MAIGLLLAAAGMFFIWMVLKRKARAIMQWPSTPGQVLSSELRFERCGNEQAKDVAYVFYSYSVDGAALKGNRIALGGSGQRSPKAAVAYYQPGKPVEVYYDPAKPTSSVLERRLSRNVMVLPIMAVLFMTVSFFLFGH